MLKKGSKLNSILTGSCPKCQNESMYVDKNPLHLGKVLKMNENCSHCGLKYQIEPSFFYGAMYELWIKCCGGCSSIYYRQRIFKFGLGTKFYSHYWNGNIGLSICGALGKEYLY
jgi:hypothetical protein